MSEFSTIFTAKVRNATHVAIIVLRSGKRGSSIARFPIRGVVVFILLDRLWHILGDEVVQFDDFVRKRL